LKIEKNWNYEILDKYNEILMDNYGDKIELKRDLNSSIACVGHGLGRRLGLECVESRERKNMVFYKYKNYLLGVRILDENMREDEVVVQRHKEEMKEVMIWNVKGLSMSNIEKNEFLKGNVIKWKDIRVNKDEFIREFGDLRWRFVNGEIINKEISYKLPSLVSELRELEYDDKIGVIDFETYGSKLNGFGDHNAYAGGWCRKGKLEMMYINENEESEDFVVRVIDSIFDDKDNSNLTFYAHNLGRFDSLILLKGILGKNGYIVKGLWKDNSVISLVVKDARTKMKIKLLDSLHLLKDNLRNVLKSYECDILKGIFPYRFMSKEKLFYLGRKPELNFYDGIDLNEYKKIDSENWSAKEETLKYLRSDLNGLLEVMLKFSKTYYEKYHVNVTKYRTLPGLTFAMFTSNFYDEENTIKMVKGSLETDIRSSYFGGNVDVFAHEIISVAFYYDMNSQYPFAMLNDMPVGDPILSNETNINNFFGFAYGEIIPPSESKLKNLYIQKRNDNGSVSCPRHRFKRLIFSEEIKYAISEGYQFNKEGGYSTNFKWRIFWQVIGKMKSIKNIFNEGVFYSPLKLLNCQTKIWNLNKDIKSTLGRYFATESNKDFGFFERKILYKQFRRNKKYVKVENGFLNLDKKLELDSGIKGIKGYKEHVYLLGNSQLLLNQDLFYQRFQDFVNQIPGNMVLSVLLEVQSDYKNFTIGESVHLTSGMNISDLCDRWFLKLQDKINEYPEIEIELDDNFEDNDEFDLQTLQIFLCYRLWINTSDYLKLQEDRDKSSIIKSNLLDSRSKLVKILDKEIKQKIASESVNILEMSRSGLNVGKMLDNINNYFKIYDSNGEIDLKLEYIKLVFNLDYKNLKVSNVEILNVYEFINIKTISDINNYLILELKSENKDLSNVARKYLLKEYLIVEKSRIIVDLENYLNSKNKYSRLAWTDKIYFKSDSDDIVSKNEEISDITFVRELITGDKQKFYFNSTGLKYVEIPQYYPDLPIFINKLTHNLKIGVIDFETYLDSNNKSVVYAGGIACYFKSWRKGEEIYSLFEYADLDNNIVGPSLIKKLIFNLFKEKGKEINGYTFYSHNLGRFDGILLVSGFSGDTHYKFIPLVTDVHLLTIIGGRSREYF